MISSPVFSAGKGSECCDDSAVTIYMDRMTFKSFEGSLCQVLGSTVSGCDRCAERGLHIPKEKERCNNIIVYCHFVLYSLSL